LASLGYGDRLLVKVWSITSGQTLTTISSVYGRVSKLQLLSNGIHLAVAKYETYDGKIDIYNVNTGALEYFLQGGSCSSVDDLIRISNSDLIVSQCYNYGKTVVRVWKTTQPVANKFNLYVQNYMNDLIQLSSDILASVNLNSRILLWNITSTQLMKNFTIQCTKFAKSNDFSFSLDEKQTPLVCSNGQDIQIWNWTSGEYMNRIQTGSDIGSLSILYLSPSSKQLFVHVLFMIDRDLIEHFFYELNLLFCVF
jgi:WD40 repeat protein